jgi:hypothetical protein
MSLFYILKFQNKKASNNILFDEKQKLELLTPSKQKQKNYKKKKVIFDIRMKSWQEMKLPQLFQEISNYNYRK